MTDFVEDADIFYVDYMNIPPEYKKIKDDKLIIKAPDFDALELSRSNLLSIKQVMLEKKQRIELRLSELSKAIREIDSDIGKLSEES